MLRPGNEQLVNLRERECSRHRKVQVVNESGKRKLGQAFEGWREVQFRDFLGGSVAKISCCQFRDLGLIPDKGTRSHMLQLKTFSMPQLRPSKDKHTHIKSPVQYRESKGKTGEDYRSRNGPDNGRPVKSCLRVIKLLRNCSFRSINLFSCILTILEFAILTR